MAVRKTKEAAAPQAEEVKAVKAEEAKETKAKAVKTAAKTKEAKAETAPKKTAKAKAEAPAKEESAKPVRKAKAGTSANIHIQFSGKSYTQEDLVKIAKDVWEYDLKKKPAALKTVELYVKPEEGLAYYVFNGEEDGSFAI